MNSSSLIHDPKATETLSNMEVMNDSPFDNGFSKNQDFIYENVKQRKRKLQGVTQPSCLNAKFFPMIFGLDQSIQDGCKQDVELTGLDQDPYTQNIIIAGRVPTSYQCLILGMQGTSPRGFMAMFSPQGVLEWALHSDNSPASTGGPAVDTIMAPRFFTYDTTGSNTFVGYVFAVLTNTNQAAVIQTTGNYQVTTFPRYGPTFRIIKILASTGDVEAEQQYSLVGPPAPTYIWFQEFRMETDQQKTSTNTNIYIITSVRSDYPDWSNTLYQALIMQVSASIPALNITKFVTYGLSVQNYAHDLVLGQTATPSLYVLGKYNDGAGWYRPFVAKHSTSDLSVSNFVHSTVGTSASNTYTFSFPARIGVCETLGYFYFAQNKDSYNSKVQITGGLTADMSLTKTIAFSAITTTITLNIFEFYYKCDADPLKTYLALVYTNQYTVYFVRIANPYTSTTAIYKKFTRGITGTTIPINALRSAFSQLNTFGLIAWNQKDYLQQSTTWLNRIIIHKIDFFSTVWDFSKFNCVDTTVNYLADTSVTISWLTPTFVSIVVTPVDNGGAMWDAINLYYDTPQWNQVQAGSYSLGTTIEPTITPQNQIEKYYMLFDQSYTYVVPCMNGGCPTYTVNCYPPYDWSPKSYQFTLDVDGNPTTYTMPTVIDCLGRYPSVLSVNPLKYPSGTSLTGTDSSLFSFSPGAADNQFSLQLDQSMNNLYGSKDVRFITQLGSVNQQNIYVRFTITRSDYRDPTIANGTTGPSSTNCIYEKIFPFFMGHDFDVNVTFTNMDPWGNILYAGYGSKPPYSFSNAVQQGYIAMIDQKGIPYWVFMVKDEILTAGNLNNICTYVAHQSTSNGEAVYAICNGYRFDLADALSNYKVAPVLIKIDHGSGQVQYMRYLPVDSYGNNMLQNGLFAAYQNNGTFPNRVFAVYRYRVGSTTPAVPQAQNFAVIKFCEDNFFVDAFNIFNSPDPNNNLITTLANPKLGWFSIYVISDGVFFFPIVYAEGALGVFIYQIDYNNMGGQKWAKIAVTTAASTATDLQPCIYGATNMLVPIINNIWTSTAGSTVDTLYIYQLNRNTLASVNSVAITMTLFINIRNAGIVTDTQSNIYVYASDSQMIFYKFDSAFVVKKSKLLKSTGSGGSMLGKGIFNYQDTGFFVILGGTWLSGASPSTVILKANSNFDFSGFTCGLSIQDINSWDTNYYIPTPVVTPTPTVTVTNSLPNLVGVNYYQSTWPLLTEAFSLQLQSISFDTNNALQTSIGAIQVPNFYKSPQINQQCYMYEVVTAFQNVDGTGAVVNSYTYNNNSGQLVITPTAISPTVTSCQGRTMSQRILDPHNPNGAGPATAFSWLTFSQTNINVDTTFTTPAAAQMVIRYFDEVNGESMGYWDNNILISVYGDNQTALTHGMYDIQKCSQNIYPFSFGGNDQSRSPAAGNNMIGHGFNFVSDDFNLIVSGRTQNLTNDDGTSYDGYVMRVSTLGFINWLTYISSKQGMNEYVGNAVYQGGASKYIYANYHSLHTVPLSKTSAIVKLTYDEGKLVFAKQIMYQDTIYFPPTTITRHGAWTIDADPTDTSRLIVTSILIFGSNGYHVAITMIRDDGITLSVTNNYYIRPQQQTLAAQSYVPLMSSFTFNDLPATAGAYFGVVHYLDPVNANPNVVYGRFNQGTGAIDWTTGLPGSLALSYEATTQPHVLQRKGRLFTVVAINTGTTNQKGCVYLSIFTIATGVQSANKYAVLDPLNTLQNVQLVTDMSNSASSGFNLYLVSVPINGQYVQIQQIDDALNFNTNALRYHDQASPNYVDNTGFNNKYMVVQSPDSYYFMVNFQRHFQTTKIETVLFRQDYNYQLSGMYTCHQWTVTAGGYSLITNYATTLLTANQQSYTFFQWNSLQMIDNSLIRVQQFQNFANQYHYPQRESQSVHFYDELLPQTSCQVVQPTSINDIPALTLNLLDVKSSTPLDNTFFYQCQQMPYTYSLYYMDSGTQSPILGLDDYITLDNTQFVVNVDTSGTQTSTPIFQSFRGIKVRSVNAIYTNQITWHLMPIMIFDQNQNAATRTIQTRAVPCLAKTEWPKVLSDADLKPSVYTGMHIDQTQGNMFLCGWSQMNSHLLQAYPLNTQKHAIVILLDNLGDVMWHYSFTSTKAAIVGPPAVAAPDLTAQACRFSGALDAIFTLLWESQAQELSLMKQGYDKGTIIFIRKLPGTFDGTDGLMTMEHDYQTSPTSVSSLYIGARLYAASGAWNQWHLYRIDMTQSIPRQYWHSYKTSSQANLQEYQAIDAIGLSTNVIVATSFFETTLRRHALIQVDKTTGAYTQYVLKVTANCKQSGASTLQTFRSQHFVIDKSTGGGLYYAYLDQSSASNDKLRYARINEGTFAVNYELEITLTGGVASTPSVSVVVDGNSLTTGYAFIFIANNLQNNYLIQFAKNGGAIQKYTTIAGKSTSQHMIARTGYFTTQNSLFLTFTATNYVTSATSGIINKLQGDLTFPESCIGATTVTTPTITNLTATTPTIANYPAPLPTATLVSTYLSLFTTDKIYGEIINFSLLLGFGFRSAESLGCPAIPVTFNSAPPNIQIGVSASVNPNVIYNIPGATQCAQVQLLGTWSVDRSADPNAQPAWIQITTPAAPAQLTGAGGQFTISPTTAEIGSYTVRIKYYSPVNYGWYDQTFVIDVYPIPDYSITAPTTTCVTDIFPLTLGNYLSISVLDGDFDSVNNQYIVCGGTSSTKNARNSGYESAYIQSYNKNIMPNYQLIFEMGVYQSRMVQCQFGPSAQGHIYLGINAKSSAVATTFDKIYFYKYHHNSAKFVDGKMFGAPGEIAILSSIFVDKNTGDQYYSGQYRGSLLSVPVANIDSFVMRINPSFVIQWFRTFQGPTFSLAQTLLSDGNNGVYVHIKELVSGSAYAMRLLKLGYSSPGNIAWGNYIYDATYMSNPIGPGGIARDLTSSYTYSCMVIGNAANTVIQTLVMKFDANSGNKISNVQLFTPSAVDCSLGYQSTSAKILLSISYSTGVSELISFDVSNTNLNIGSTLPRLRFLPTGYKQMGGGRMFLSQSTTDLYIFYPSQQSATPFYSSMFITKVNDLVGMNWPTEIGCPSIHLRDTDTTLYNTNYKYLSPSFGGDNQDNTNQIVQSLTASIPTVSITTSLLAVYMRNPDQIAIYYDSGTVKPLMDLKFSYSAICSVWARPTQSVLLNRTGSANYSAGSTVYTVQQPSFVTNHCQGLTFTYSSTLLNGNALLPWMVFDPIAITYTFSPNSNNYVGSYDLLMIATITNNPTYQQQPIKSQAQFQILVITNVQPTIDPYSYNLTDWTYAHHNWNVTPKMLNDNEGDDPYMDAKIVKDVGGVFVVQTKPSWFVIDNSTSKQIYISFVNPPQPVSPATSSLWVIQIIIWDMYNTLTPAYYYTNITVYKNYAPYLISPSSINFTLPTIQVPFGFTTSFSYSLFQDDEGDTIVIDCTNMKYNTSVVSTWTTCNNNVTSGTVTISGTTPKSNTAAGNYVFTIVVYDQYQDGSQNVYTYNMLVKPKPSLIVTGGPASVSTRLPYPTSVSTLAYSYDNDTLPYRKVLYVNNTIWTNSAFGTWMVWDESIQNVTVTPNQNTQAGQHQMCVLLNDQITQPLTINFTIEVIPDYPLNPLVTLPNVQAIVNNWFYFDFDKFAIFQNPEADQKTNITMFFRQKDSNPPTLPYFIKVYDNGTLYGLGSLADVGTYALECVGIDDAGWYTPIGFTITVQPCYYKCSGCWNTDYNTCFSCHKGYYLLMAECNDLCPQGTYADDVLNQCFVCPSTCKICIGPDATQNCSVCNTGFYQLAQGCYEICPDGYWGDNQDYNCKPCNDACTKCTGPLSTQCYGCANLYQLNDIGVIAKSGYLLVGTSCQVPKCGDGQYFQWDKKANELGNVMGVCAACHPHCKMCVGPRDIDCVNCVAGRQLVPETHECKLCPELNPGLELNEELECQDKCGDGVIVSSPCDDGNKANGDGCSSTCYVEFGYVCDTPGQPCRNIVPPTFSITANSLTNQHYVQFSNTTMVTSNTTISPENMVVEIDGKKGPYKFSWRVIPDPKSPLLPGYPINKFSIKLFNIMTTLTGDETVKITFLDYSQIYQAYWNTTLVNNSFAERNVAPFVYISAGEANTVAGGGQSMKYAFLTAMGFQLGLKIIINGSMQYLWGLVHALQVFQYLMLMNINFPPNMPAFVAFFSIASGDTSQMGVASYIPDITKFLINVDDINGQYDNELLPPKFVANQISPYFIIAYSNKLSTWTLALFVLLPILLLMNKICKKVKIWENVLGGFFFNGPLRTFVEMYFEMVIQVVVNTSFVKFRNQSQIIATGTAFLFGALALLFPFILMSAIYANRKVIRKRIYMVKYGMLTDEFSQKSITQLYYYPAFLFQRMSFAAIIVFLYQYPLLQCMLAALANVAMALYLVIVRPYKEENQQTTQVVDELILFICILFFIYIYMTQDTMEADQQKTIGWIVIFIMMFSILKNLFVVLYFGFLNMRGKMKSMFSAEDEQLETPHTSDDDSDTIDSVDTEEIEEDVRREEYEREEYNDLMRQKQEEQMIKEGDNKKQAKKNNSISIDDPYSQMQGGGFSSSPFGGSSPMNLQRQHTPVHLPGQLVNEFEEPEQDPNILAVPNGPKTKPQPKELRKNNFFKNDDRMVTQENHISQLEEIANDYGAEYGYEYGDYGDYGQEEPQQEEREDWGDNLNKPTTIKEEKPVKKEPVFKFGETEQASSTPAKKNANPEEEKEEEEEEKKAPVQKTTHKQVQKEQPNPVKQPKTSPKENDQKIHEAQNDENLNETKAPINKAKKEASDIADHSSAAVNESGSHQKEKDHLAQQPKKPEESQEAKGDKQTQKMQDVNDFDDLGNLDDLDGQL